MKSPIFKNFFLFEAREEIESFWTQLCEAMVPGVSGLLVSTIQFLTIHVSSCPY